MNLFHAAPPPPEAKDFEPFWYQVSAQEQVRSAWENARDAGEPACRRLLVSSTGSGKTEMIWMGWRAIPELPRRLFLVHTDGLVWQSAKRAQKAFPGLSVQVEKARDRADLTTADIVVASIQTLGDNDPTDPHGFSRRLRRFSDGWNIALDEAHATKLGGMADRVLSYWGVGSGEFGVSPDRARQMRRAPDVPSMLLGASATPARHDKQPLSYWFDDYIRNPYATAKDIARGEDFFHLRFMIDQGFLVEPVVERIETGIDISHVRKNGRINQGELETAINVEERNLLIVKTHIQKGGRCGIVFTQGVDHSKALAECFNEHGVTAEHIDGSYDRRRRRAIYAGHASGEVAVLVNDSVAVLGYDNPRIDTVHLARPTKSHPRYAQEFGRGTRLLCSMKGLTRYDQAAERKARIAASEKEVWYAFDYADMAGKIDLVKAPVLFGLRSDYDASGKRMLTDNVERIEALEAANPLKRDLRSGLSLADIEVKSQRIDPFDMAEGDPAVIAISSLNWLRLSESTVQLAIPDERDRATRQTVSPGFAIQAVRDGTGAWRLDQIHRSRWNGSTREPERIVRGNKRYPSMATAVSAVDAWVRKEKRSLVGLMERDPSWNAPDPTTGQVRELKRLRVPVDPSEIDKATASRLILAAQALQNA